MDTGTYLPTTIDLAAAMSALRIPGDPAYLMKDHPDARRRAELLARVAAWATMYLRAAEDRAGLGVDDRADLHWAADRDVSGASATALLTLQIDRLAWVHQTIARGRGVYANPTAEGVSAVLSALVLLLDAWCSDGRPLDDPPAELVSPILADCLLAFALTADRLVRELR